MATQHLRWIPLRESSTDESPVAARLVAIAQGRHLLGSTGDRTPYGAGPIPAMTWPGPARRPEPIRSRQLVGGS